MLFCPKRDRRKQMRATPQFNKGDGLIKLISPKGNLNIIQASLIRNITQRERDDSEPKTDIVLIHSGDMPGHYTVKVPIAIMETYWRLALRGHDIDLAGYSGEEGGYMARLDTSVISNPAPHTPKRRLQGLSTTTPA